MGSENVRRIAAYSAGDVPFDRYWWLRSVVYTGSMIILIHVVIAFTSLIIASFAYFQPSIKKLIVSYGFILATVGTGTYLLVTVPSHILQSCLSGLTYLTVVSIVTIAAHVRLRRRTITLAEQEN